MPRPAARVPLTFARWRLGRRARRYRTKSDRAEIEVLLEYLGPAGTALDVGAYKGAYLYWMRHAVGDRGKVWAFEPQREAARELERLVTACGWNNVAIEAIALSDFLGETALFLPGDRATSSAATLEPHRFGAEGGVSTCRTTTLDAWARRRELAALDFLKCDVEGHELAVLRGARATLERFRPTLLVECERRHAGHSVHEELFSSLAALDYDGWFFHHGERLPIDRFDADRHQRPEELDAGRADRYANNFLFRPSPSGRS